MDAYKEENYTRYCDNLLERYNKTFAVNETRGCLNILRKPEFSSISTTAFLWSQEPTGEKVQNYKLLGKYKTLHSYGYILFFKPDLCEVLSQLPKKVFENEKIYVNTLPENNRATWNTCGDYHKGVTFVYV